MPNLALERAPLSEKQSEATALRRAGAGGAQAVSPPGTALPAPDALCICVSNSGKRVVQRVLLPGGEAFVVVHGSSGWRVSEGQRLPASTVSALTGAAEQARFFEFPERLPERDTNGLGGNESGLWMASTERRHHSRSYQRGPAERSGFNELFAACETAFAGLELVESDLRGAIAIYRTLEDYAKGLAATDPRRALLLEWLDSLQADYATP